jgi:hypothetical protein
VWLRRRNKNNPHFHLADELQRVTGVDLTRIDDVDVMVAQTLVSEVGLDMSRWKTEVHFASWLGLCPDNRISGDKVLARGTRHVVNRAATALGMGASTLLRSQTYLGAQYRGSRSKLGAPKVITALAHRLARLVYRMLKKIASAGVCVHTSLWLGGENTYSRLHLFRSPRRLSPIPLYVRKKTHLRPVFPEDGFPISRSTVATDIALKQSR